MNESNEYSRHKSVDPRRNLMNRLMIGLFGLHFALRAIAGNAGPIEAYYPFSGDASDESGKGNHGNPVGAALTSDRFGNPDSAYRFDGNDSIDCGNGDSINIEGSMTLAAWVKLDPVGAGSNIPEAFIGKFGSLPTGQDNQYVFGLQKRGLLCFQPFLHGQALNIVWENPNWQVNEWNHVAATYDASTDTAKLYFNGVLRNTKELRAEPFTTSVALSLGATAADGPKRFLNGCLDEVRIYSNVLTEQEILDIMNPVDEQHLVGYYPFNGDALDESGKGNHGNPVGAALTSDRFGNPDSAYRFDGNDSIDCGNGDSINIDGSMTLAAWVKLDPVGAGSNIPEAFIGKFGSLPTGQDNQYVFGLQKRGLLCFQPFLHGQALNIVWENPNWQVNEWNHVAATYDAATDTAKLYFNGVLRNTKELRAEPFTTSVALSLGATAADGPKRYLNGSLDEVRIYSAVLTEQELDLLANSQGVQDSNSLPGIVSLITKQTGNGVPPSEFSFRLSVPTGRQARVQASKDMDNWIDISPQPIIGILDFSDPDSIHEELRFYRVIIE